jgi:hypothetical protein
VPVPVGKALVGIGDAVVDPLQHATPPAVTGTGGALAVALGVRAVIIGLLLRTLRASALLLGRSLGLFGPRLRLPLALVLGLRLQTRVRGRLAGFAGLPRQRLGLCLQRCARLSGLFGEPGIVAGLRLHALGDALTERVVAVAGGGAVIHRAQAPAGAVAIAAVAITGHVPGGVLGVRRIGVCPGFWCPRNWPMTYESMAILASLSKCHSTLTPNIP